LAGAVVPPSQIELVERIVSAWNERDWETAESLCDPDIVADYSRRLPESGIYRGHAAGREFRLSLHEPWAEVRIEIDDARVYGDKVVALMRVVARGKASGAEVEARFADVWTFRAGLAIRLEYFGDRDEAIAAAAAGVSGSSRPGRR
jgi:ketosteroid isomerase-like protein